MHFAYYCLFLLKGFGNLMSKTVIGIKYEIKSLAIIALTQYKLWYKVFMINSQSFEHFNSSSFTCFFNSVNIKTRSLFLFHYSCIIIVYVKSVSLTSTSCKRCIYNIIIFMCKSMHVIIIRFLAYNTYSI